MEQFEPFEQTGKSVEEAVRAAEERIGRALRKEEYQVIDVGTRGVLGLIGSRPAKVMVRSGGVPAETRDDGSLEAYAVSCAQTLLSYMGLKGRATGSQQEDCLQVDLDMSEEEGGILIGRRGATLEAFQHMVRRLVERKAGEPVSIVVDVGGYRQRRKDALVQRALRLAEQVKRSGRQVTLDPMPPSERRAVHMALKPDKGITTYSVGQEPDRKVVIAPAEGAKRQRRRPERERIPGDDEAPWGRRGEGEEDDSEAEATDEPIIEEAPIRSVGIEEVVPTGTPVYGRRRTYRKPRNRPTRPAGNGF